MKWGNRVSAWWVCKQKKKQKKVKNLGTERKTLRERGLLQVNEIKNGTVITYGGPKRKAGEETSFTEFQKVGPLRSRV